MTPTRTHIVLRDYTTRRAIARLAWEASGVAVVITGLLLILLLKKPHEVAT